MIVSFYLGISQTWITRRESVSSEPGGTNGLSPAKSQHLSIWVGGSWPYNAKRQRFLPEAIIPVTHNLESGIINGAS